MQHKIPVISEIKLELIDVEFFFEDQIDNENISVNITTKTSFKSKNLIVFFIHIRYSLDSNDKKHSVFHTDYLSIVEIDEADWSNADNVEIDKSLLAHLLGMSFLMIRGSISSRLSGNYLSVINLPVINPLEILKNNLEENENKFILTTELEAHRQ